MNTKLSKLKKMKPIKDIYWIEVVKQTEDTFTLNGVEMYRDTSYDPMRLARQFGTVYEVPIHNNLDIQKGDKIWFHHFVATDANKVKYIDDKEVYQATRDQIYLVERDGEMIPIGVWNFIKQERKEAEKTESGIFLETSASDVELHGHAVYINDWMKDQGVKKGDRVFFSENSEYDMNINGESLLRMRNFDILGVYEGAK